MKNEVYKNYLKDLIDILKEKTEETMRIKKKNKFNKDKIFVFYEVFDLIIQQAIAFQIPLEEIGLHNFDIETIFFPHLK